MLLTYIPKGKYDELDPNSWLGRNKPCQNECHKCLMISVLNGKSITIRCPTCGEKITIHGSNSSL